MRRIKTLTSGNRAAIVYKSRTPFLDGIEDEYVVKFSTDGVHDAEADYFTDDREDAVNTAEIQIGLRSLKPQ